MQRVTESGEIRPICMRTMEIIHKNCTKDNTPAGAFQQEIHDTSVTFATRTYGNLLPHINFVVHRSPFNSNSNSSCTLSSGIITVITAEATAQQHIEFMFVQSIAFYVHHLSYCWLAHQPPLRLNGVFMIIASENSLRRRKDKVLFVQCEQHGALTFRNSANASPAMTSLSIYRRLRMVTLCEVECCYSVVVELSAASAMLAATNINLIYAFD